jgi:hypothetical protein
MATEGNIDMWADQFEDVLIPKIFNLIIEAWNNFPQPLPTDLEVPITQRFCVCLRKIKNRSQLPFRIEWELWELDSETSERKGRIDLSFFTGYRENVYFSLECKRLSVCFPSGRQSLAQDYVQDGMMRYMTGQYAEGLNKGGMVGYVMDGKVEPAICNVKAAIEKNKDKLSLTHAEGLCPSSIKPQHPHVKETRHTIRKSHFAIHHLFLPVK